MPGTGKDVQFRRDSGLLETKISFGEPFRNILSIPKTAGEKRRRHTVRRLDVSGFSRINQRLKSGPASLLVHLVLRIRESVVIARTDKPE